MSPAAPLVPFTPTAVDPEHLERRTVGRSEVLDDLLDRARAATRGLDRAHTLLVAPRGGGKTHVLTLLAHRLRSAEEFAERLRIVVIPEDAVEVSSYLDLLVSIAEDLGTEQDAARARVMRRDADRRELEQLLLGLLGGRPMVLVVENLDRIFKELESEGQRQLRAFVETSRAIQLVASTPALFEAVSQRTEPWFGSFAIERLSPWSLDEGAAFLTRIAREGGDTDLAKLIESPLGRARLAAVERLVGGLPRLWTILANCITVELLDELVPLVLTTFEELVPYYQARLSELAPGERKLVVALCRAEMLGGSSGRTVRDLALAAGVPETSAPKLLSRLEDAGWVRATKPSGTDRRATWYEIREPLLRYHVTYRRQAGEPLSLIVSFLRAWFTPSERRRHLAGATAGSIAESYLVESLRDALTPSDSLYQAADPLDLLGGAREWFAGASGGSQPRSQLAAILSEAVALVALGKTADVEATLARRLGALGVGQRVLAERIVRAGVAAARAADEPAPRAMAQAGLDAAIPPSAEAPLDDRLAIALIAHGWRGATGDAEGAYRGVKDLLSLSERLPASGVALRLAVEAEFAFFGCEIGDPGASELMQRVCDDRSALLGSEHPDTLTSRSNLAGRIGEAGDHAAARDLYAAITRDRQRVLGADHPDTLSSRQGLAYHTGEAGHGETARDLYAALVADRERILGADHPHTLTSRHGLAHYTGATGDHTTARDLSVALVADRERVLGPDHTDTLTSRHELAYQTGAAGDHITARDLYAALVADRERVLGPDHIDTLTSRHELAYHTGEASDDATARDLYAALVADRERVLGPNHPSTLNCRYGLAYETAAMRNHVTARDLYAALVAESERALGADHLNTLTSRHNLACETAAAGDHGTARDLFAALAVDQNRVLGRDHDLSLATAAMSLMYVTPRGRLRKTALALLDRDIPDAVRERVLATLGRAYAGATGDTFVPADREAIAHLLSGRGRAPVSLVTSAPSSPDLMGVFVSAVSDDAAKLAVLSTTILAALRARDWERSEVLAWLRSWSEALAEVEAAEVPHHILDVLIAEIGGDATARLSLPPELREIVPTISIV